MIMELLLAWLLEVNNTICSHTIYFFILLTSLLVENTPYGKFSMGKSQYCWYWMNDFILRGTSLVAARLNNRLVLFIVKMLILLNLNKLIILENWLNDMLIRKFSCLLHICIIFFEIYYNKLIWLPYTLFNE